MHCPNNSVNMVYFAMSQTSNPRTGSDLELTTLALASLNGITFVLWWDKPHGAQAIVRVYLKRKLTHSERVIVSVSGDISSDFDLWLFDSTV